MQQTTQKWRDLRKTIGDNIHKCRKNKKLSLQKLSRITTIPEYVIDNYELGKGNIQFYILIKLAAALNADIKDLLES